MRAGFLMAALLAGAAMAVPAAAQQVRNLDHEETNARVFNGVYNEKPVLFEVTLPAGQAMRVDVMSTSEFDPYLKIYNAETGDLIAENDDGGEGLNSRAMVTATQDMHLRIAVSSYGARDEADGLAGTGEDIVEGGFVSGSSFDLKLTVLDYELQPMRAVTWGSEEKGQFFGGEEHLYTITGEEGLLLEVAMIADPDDSSGLDPYLTLRDAMLDDGWTPVAGACQGVFNVPCEDFPEIENCTGTGLGFCDMTFERNQSCLSVVITDGPPSLEDRQDAPVYSTRKYAKPCRSNPVLGDSQT